RRGLLRRLSLRRSLRRCSRHATLKNAPENARCQHRERIDTELWLVESARCFIGHAENALALFGNQDVTHHRQRTEHAIEAVDRPNGSPQIHAARLAIDIPVSRQSNRWPRRMRIMNRNDAILFTEGHL